MEKLAVIKLNPDNIKLQFVNFIRNKSFIVYDEVNMPVNLTKDFYSDYFIKPAIIKEVISTLKVFKRMLDVEGITETLCFATSLLNEAKNDNGFLDQIESVSGLRFKIIDPAEECNYIYMAIINSFNKPKGVIFNLSNYYTSFVYYNRRNIIDSCTINLGYENMYNKYVVNQGLSGNELFKAVSDEYLTELKKYEWTLNLPDEFEVITTGNMFVNLASISRKARKYPIEVVHNYKMNKDDCEKVYNVLKNQDMTKTTKVKGISIEDSKYLQVAFTMINTYLQNSNRDEISVSKTGFIEGVLFNQIIPLTLEKPISDTLGYSLNAINDFYDNGNPRAIKVYDICMMLFKQLKVLHKLGRSYVRVLRIASYLYNSGLRINSSDKEKIAFNIILNSNLYGVTHTEIVLAAFVSLISEADNFNLSDWIKYRDLVSDEELANVKKLAVILKIAQSLDITGFGSVEDLNCDILGDSVIIKTVVKEDASLEIKHAMLYGNEFKKAYNKNLEIL